MDTMMAPAQQGSADRNERSEGGSSAPRTSKALFKRQVSLKSHQAQSIYKRQFNMLGSKLYQLSVVLSIIATEKGSSAVEAIVDAELKALADEIAAEKQRMGVMLNENMIEWTMVEFDAPLVVVAEITSPRLGRYLAMLQQIDELMAMIEALWLSGLLTDKQHKDGCYKWQRSVTRSGNRVIAITQRAMSYARRMSASLGGTATISKLKDRKLSPEIEAEAMKLVSDLEGTVGVERIEKSELDNRNDDKAEDDRDAAFGARVAEVLGREVLTDIPGAIDTPKV